MYLWVHTKKETIYISVFERVLCWNKNSKGWFVFKW